MKKLLPQISVACVCVLLGFMLSSQFKFLKQKDTKVLANGSINTTDIMNEIEGLKEQKAELEKRNNEVTGQIKKFESAAADQNLATKDIQKQLYDSRLLLGIVDVHGPGLTIYITPKAPELNTLTSYISELEIIHLINELYFGGAEAISINDSRLILESYIRMTSNNSDLIVNSDKIPRSSRIIIKAIGDKNMLYDAMDFPGVLSYGALSKYDVKMEKSNDLKILKYSKPYNYDNIESASTKK